MFKSPRDLRCAKTFAAAVLTAYAMGAAAARGAVIVYDVDQIIDGGSVTGTITTDGKIGVLSPSDFDA